jgi:hypothetical protein
MEVMSLLVFLVTGKPAEDLRPVNGATKLACAKEARLTVVTAAEEIKAIFAQLLSFLVHQVLNFCFYWLMLQLKLAIYPKVKYMFE